MRLADEKCGSSLFIVLLDVVVVGGMITSTLLTLFVIPVIYTWFADIFRRRERA